MDKETKEIYSEVYEILIEEQNIKEETIDMIALFYLNYWCEREAEKQEFRKILQENEDIYQQQLKQKYNSDKLFKNKQKIEHEEVQLIEYKKNIFKRIINKIKSILGINY